MRAVRGYRYIYLTETISFVYRRKIPKDVRPHLPAKNGKQQREWKHALRSTSLAQAERKAAPLTARYDAVCEAVARGEVIDEAIIKEAEANALRMLDGPSADLHAMLAFFADDFGEDRGKWQAGPRALVNAIEHGGQYVAGMPVSATYEADKVRHAEMGGSRSEKPIIEAVEDFKAVVGDKDVQAITYREVEDWISAMRRGVTRKDGTKRPMAPATIRRRVGALRAIVGRAYRLHSIERLNPFSGHNVGGAGKATDRLPLNNAMLDALSNYLATNRRVRNETRRILTLMICTGADVGEIGGLAKGDINLHHDVPHLIIRPNKIRTLKAEARDRRVPLVGDALKAAKESVVGLRKPSEQVFETYGRYGRGADWLSARLNKTIRAAGIPKSKRLTSKSLRHTVRRQAAGDAGHRQSFPTPSDGPPTRPVTLASPKPRAGHE